MDVGETRPFFSGHLPTTVIGPLALDMRMGDERMCTMRSESFSRHRFARLPVPDVCCRRCFSRNRNLRRFSLTKRPREYRPGDAGSTTDELLA